MRGSGTTFTFLRLGYGNAKFAHRPGQQFRSETDEPAKGHFTKDQLNDEESRGSGLVSGSRRRFRQKPEQIKASIEDIQRATHQEGPGAHFRKLFRDKENGDSGEEQPGENDEKFLWRHRRNIRVAGFGDQRKSRDAEERPKKTAGGKERDFCARAA